MKTCATCRWFSPYGHNTRDGQCWLNPAWVNVPQPYWCGHHSDELRPFVLAALAAGATEGQAIERAKEVLRLLAKEEA